MSKFSERLRFLRNSVKLSQAELGNLIGLSKSSVNMYERGEREPGLETLERIADHFNVDMDYLLGKSDVERKISCDYIIFTNSTNNTHHKTCVTKNGIFLYDDELDFLMKFRLLDDRGKAAVIYILEHELKSMQATSADSPSSSQTKKNAMQNTSK